MHRPGQRHSCDDSGAIGYNTGEREREDGSAGRLWCARTRRKDPVSQREAPQKSVLWAPWRLEYILSEKEPDCLFCCKPEQGHDAENLILARGRHAFAMLNRFPYNNAHLMAIPYRHVAMLRDLTPEELQELMLFAQAYERVLTAAMAPDGMNVGMNVGAAAGAGIDEHLHLHVVPRWHGDTNFMPVLADENVIPQALRDTLQQLGPSLQEEIDRLTTTAFT